MAEKIFRVKLREVGLELIFDADASPPDNLPAIQDELANKVAHFLSRKTLIETLEAQQAQDKQEIIRLAGKGIRYIKKKHGRDKKLKTLAIYTDYEIDFDLLRQFLAKEDSLDIYDQSVRRGAPGRFVIECSADNRQDVLNEFAILATSLNVQLTPYDFRPFEFYLDRWTLSKLCAKRLIKLSGVRIPNYTFKVLNQEPKRLWPKS